MDADLQTSAWTEAYLKQLDFYAEETGNIPCRSIFFGGGTPSLMEPFCVEAIIGKIDELWGIAQDAEITLEANPTSSEAERFSAYRSAGVNRLSIGVQSLQIKNLRALGRLHSVEEAKSAVAIALRTFNRLNIDLMFGLQHQTLADWKNELRDGLQWGAEHLSLYQLTIEPNTAFGSRLRSGLLQGLPSSGLSADMQRLTVDECESAGYFQYEVSNYARPGGKSFHNLLYWRYNDFLGIGPGAHGRIWVNGRRAATETHLAPAKWLNAVSEHGTGEISRAWLTVEEQAQEYLMMSLRLNEGTDLTRYALLAGSPLSPSAAETLENDGLIKILNGRLRTTLRGQLVLNSVIAELLTQRVSA